MTNQQKEKEVSTKSIMLTHIFEKKKITKSL